MHRKCFPATTGMMARQFRSTGDPIWTRVDHMLTLLAFQMEHPLTCTGVMMPLWCHYMPSYHSPRPFTHTWSLEQWKFLRPHHHQGQLLHLCRVEALVLDGKGLNTQKQGSELQYWTASVCKILICQLVIVPLSTPRVPTPNAPAPSTKCLLDLRSTCAIALAMQALVIDHQN